MCPIELFGFPALLRSFVGRLATGRPRETAWHGIWVMAGFSFPARHRPRGYLSAPMFDSPQFRRHRANRIVSARPLVLSEVYIS
jgi:hypothetical protein